MTSSWALTAKNLLLPIFCQECAIRLLTEENGFYCPTCWELSPRIERPFCTVCGQPQQGQEGFGDLRNFPCAQCRESDDAPAYRRIYGAAHYDQAIGEAVRLLKFYDKRRIAEPLAEVMADFAEREMDLEIYDDLVPVPLHKVRQRERGFNQSLLLAEKLANLFPNARLNESLRRIRPTRIQSLLKDETDRKANVRGAFAVDRDQDFQGRTVLLIDDVVTSRGTVGECAAALRRAGAATVDVFATALAVEGPKRMNPRLELERIPGFSP